jgi:hypothetical protein
MQRFLHQSRADLSRNPKPHRRRVLLDHAVEALHYLVSELSKGKGSKRHKKLCTTAQARKSKKIHPVAAQNEPGQSSSLRLRLEKASVSDLSQLLSSLCLASTSDAIASSATASALPTAGPTLVPQASGDS